jgi:LPPG:FO 2-phospho-L-lactate transferase
MIAFLSGGTGTPKLLEGARRAIPDTEIGVVVNTAEDLWISGNHLSPDVDTVMYLFAGILDTGTWWGIRGDSFLTHEHAARLGADEFIRIGDRDRAVHIARGGMLRAGMRLTEATAALCRSFGVAARVLPMSDEPVATYVQTDNGPIHFQEYWVRHRGRIPIRSVERRAEKSPAATPEVVELLREADAVVIGPSNPVTSIAPILECEGVRTALTSAIVVAVSPFIGDRPVSGPAAELMEAWGMEPSSRGTYRLYEDLIDCFVQDIRDPVPIEGALRLDTLMTDVSKAEALYRAIQKFTRK